MAMEECFACRVNEGSIPTPGGNIYSDGHWVADHGVPPRLLGYVVLKPRRHILGVAELNPDEALAFGVAAQKVMSAVQKVLHPDRIYMCAFAEAVPHLHFHLIPRYAHMPPLGPKLLDPFFADEWLVSDAEAERAATQIREAVEAAQSD